MNRAQLSIFNYDKVINAEENIELAYRERNKEIGYHLESKGRMFA